MGILECASRDGITAIPVSAGQCWLFATLPQRETPNHQTCRAPTPARHPAAIGNCVLLVSHKFGWRVSLAHHHCAAQQKRETPCHLSAGAQDAVVDSDNRMPCPVSSTLCPAAGHVRPPAAVLLLLQHGRETTNQARGKGGVFCSNQSIGTGSSSCLRVPAP